MQQTSLSDAAAHLMREAEQLVSIVVEAAALSAERDARVCGCPGCRAQSHEAASWAAAMLSATAAATE
jgi:hypothetical protein